MTETQTMLVKTVNFGELEIPGEKVLSFKEGLPGFPKIRRFTILERDELKPFQYLQALDEPPIALLVVNPFLVDPGYQFQLSESEMLEIESSTPEDVAVYAVATVPENPEEATLNLMAPIVINHRRRLGKQVVLHQTSYSVRHPLFGGSGKNESRVQ
jgi:flagellar assembly factor FliW